LKEIEEKRALELSLLQTFSTQATALAEEKAALQGLLKQEQINAAKKGYELEDKVRDLEVEVLQLRELNSISPNPQQQQDQSSELLEQVKKLKEMNSDLSNKLQIATNEKMEKEIHHSLQLEQLEKIRLRQESHSKQYATENVTLKKKLLELSNGNRNLNTKVSSVTDSQLTGKRKRSLEDVTERKKQKLAADT